MDTGRPLLSPAKRAKRCALSLLFFFALAAGAYLRFHADHAPAQGDGTFVAASAAVPARDSPSASAVPGAVDKNRQPLSPVQLSMTGMIASMYVVPKD